MKIFLCHNAWVILLKYSCGVDCNTNGLFKKLFSDLVISHFIMFYHISIFEMEFISLCTSKRVMSVTVRILSSEHYSMFLSVLIGLVHPATSTWKILIITVHELLNGIFLNFWIESLYFSERFKCCSSWKSPTSATGLLIIWHRYKTLFKPVLVFWPCPLIHFHFFNLLYLLRLSSFFFFFLLFLSPSTCPLQSMLEFVLWKLDPTNSFGHKLLFCHVRKLVYAKLERWWSPLLIDVIVMSVNFIVIFLEIFKALIHLFFWCELFTKLSNKFEIFMLDLL